MLRRLVLPALLLAVACSGGSGGSDGSANALPAPTGVTATPLHGSIRISWSAVAGATGYVVYSQIGATLDPSTAYGQEAAAPPWDHGGTEDGTTYTFAVRALRGAEQGALSATVSAVPLSAVSRVVAQPDALVLEPGGTGTVALSVQYYDATSEDVTASATWAVEGAATFSVAAEVTVHAPAAVGPSTLVAQWAGWTVRVPVGTRRAVDHVAFVTSTYGNSNLSTWAGVAGGETGLAAADAICQARAAAAGLPGTFTAWLSTASDDAYCRVHGLSGKRSANCGQGTLPATAGPWVRPDGFPFAPAASAMAVAPGIVFVAPGEDERGAPVHAGSSWLNSSGPDGAYVASTDCSGWTSQSWLDGRPGTSYAWDAHLDGSRSGYYCGSDSTVRLLCLQQGTGPALPAYQASGKAIFLTSATGTGDLSTWADAGGASGVAAGDAICVARATAAGLPGTFKALLSADGAPASGRVAGEGEWVRSDGVVVARSRADLLNQWVFTAIAFDETGARVPVDRIAFTGLWEDGGVSPNGTCSNWTLATGTAQGQPAYNGSGQRGYQILCDGPHSLVCVEE
jgi:hypothetical protein